MAQSIFLENFRVFGGLLHQGRNIELDSLQESAVLLEDSSVWRSRSWHQGWRLQRGLLLALIYHLVEFGSVWESSSSGGSNPRYSQSSVGSTSSLRVRPNPSFVLERSSCISAFARLILYFRENFVATHILILKPSEAIPNLLLYCIRCFLSYSKVQILFVVPYLVY